MNELRQIRPAYVIGPLGGKLTLDLLPQPNPGRWVPRRKVEVVVAVQGGLLTIDEACERYSLSLEELIAWQRSLDRAGLKGLETTRSQHFRDLWERRVC